MRAELYRQLPGARVLGRDGAIGVVERIEYGQVAVDQNEDQETQDRAPEAIVVRSESGEVLYRIPMLLVSAVKELSSSKSKNKNKKANPPQFIVDLPNDQLTYYRIEEAASTAEPPRQDLDFNRDNTMRIPVAEEHLVARKSPVVQGYVRIHKEVGTQEENFTVPVYHEEAIVERIPANQYKGQQPGDDELLIPVTEERLVVRKETVVREYLRVRKETVSKEYEVKGELRHESLDVTTEVPPGSPEQHLLHIPEDENSTQPATR